MTIWAVPGFLGLASDWDHLQIDSLVAIDPNHFRCRSLEAWGSEFNRHVRQQKCKANILLGYSLGGRLGLHALIDDPSLWKKAIIVSAHPGISEEAERKLRLENDKAWAKRFLTDDWQTLMRDWGQQSVFKNEIFHFKREEKDFSRVQLARTMLFGSQGMQIDLREQISQLPMPITWIVGEKDQRYIKLKDELSFRHPASKVVVIPDAYHRIPWSHPQQLRMQFEPVD